MRVGDELVLSEMWPSVQQAHARERELRGRLLSGGWPERDWRKWQHGAVEKVER
jgi:hypothetical protein